MVGLERGKTVRLISATEDGQGHPRDSHHPSLSGRESRGTGLIIRLRSQLTIPYTPPRAPIGDEARGRISSITSIEPSASSASLDAAEAEGLTIITMYYTPDIGGYTKPVFALKAEKLGRRIARFILTRVRPGIIRLAQHIVEAWWLPLKEAIAVLTFVSLFVVIGIAAAAYA